MNGLTDAVPIWQKTLRAILQNRLAKAFGRPPEGTYRLSDELALSDQRLPIETSGGRLSFSAIPALVATLRRHTPVLGAGFLGRGGNRKKQCYPDHCGAVNYSTHPAEGTANIELRTR